MGGGERDMAGGVPILRQHDVGETLGDAVDDGNDLLAVFDGEAAAGQEAVLDIDDQQRGSPSGLIDAAQSWSAEPLAIAAPPRPARICLRSNMLHLPLR